MPGPLPAVAITLENSDVGEVFKNKINQLVTELNLNRTEFNNQLAAVVLSSDFADSSMSFRDQAQAYRDDAEVIKLATQAISSSGFPSQANQQNKVLKTDGVSIGWSFSGEYTRDETANHTLVAGDKSFIIATGAIVNATLPATIVLGQPFTIKNSLKSNDNVRVVNADFIIYDVNQNYAPLDNIILVPGEQVSLRALSTTELEIL